MQGTHGNPRIFGSFSKEVLGRRRKKLRERHIKDTSLFPEFLMEIELANCDCCGLKEDCTQQYISGVKAEFSGKWLCGLCAEAVRDEITKGKATSGIDEAINSHMAFCRKCKSNPAVQVADGMCQLLRKRSGRFQGRKA
ncbi:hypothetical protein EJ110_NYTH03994 [Nymphaea thermarum]|nr:hypothetical protein EJ110_NYTH03994 [Nymphaea thermarum]